MTDFRVMLGLIATIIAIVGYIPYFRNILSGKTKPHAFSWLIWSMLTGIAFAAQVVEEGGPGAWVTGFTALGCFTIFILSLFKGKRTFVLFDWFALAASLVALLLWWLTADPTMSVILITLTDAIGFLPTFRKTFYKPYEETIVLFALGGLKFLISLFALETITISTWLYPASLVLMNWLFVSIVLLRRKHVKPIR